MFQTLNTISGLKPTLLKASTPKPDQGLTLYPHYGVGPEP